MQTLHAMSRSENDIQVSVKLIMELFTTLNSAKPNTFVLEKNRTDDGNSEHRLAISNYTLYSVVDYFEHKVEKGETLAKIATKRTGFAGHWVEIFEFNKVANGCVIENSNLIMPGWILRIPNKIMLK